MRSFRELSIKPAYDSGDSGTDILEDFYLPVLSSAKSYDRLTAYFSSTVLSLAARGVAGLISNGGKMRLIASPQFSAQDIDVLEKNPSESDRDAVVSDLFMKLVSDVEALALRIQRDHLRALAWMLKDGYLDIRVLLPRELDGRAGIFHSKVGILADSEGNRISFSGSVNETAAAWRHNVEEFKVFRSWAPGGPEFVDHDQDQFERYWNPSLELPFETRAIPQQARQALIEIAPSSLEALELIPIPEPDDEENLPRLRPYQEEAVKAWSAAGMRGTLEMATGTGKTRTALECIREFQASNARSLTVITAPFQHIAVQWRELLAPYGVVSTFDSGNWRDRFADNVHQLRMRQTDHLVWLAVQNTAASKDFLAFVDEARSRVDAALFVGDEAHGLGSREFRKALSDSYDARLGLSATPTRWFDEDGTTALATFFGATVFEFSLRDALTWIDPETGQTPLAPYEYEPIFVDFNESEMDEYVQLSLQISREIAKSKKDEMSEGLELLLFKRAALIKLADSKLDALEQIIDAKSDHRGTIIYCHNLEQLRKVEEIVSARRIKFRRFTGEEGTGPRKELFGLSEREFILKNFAETDIEVLVAMKCLDEGVDVPSAKRGIILASSGNTREFIQRRGRLLRRFPGKKVANVTDLVVIPEFHNGVPADIASAGRKIVTKELVRINEFSQDAQNFEIISTKVLKKLRESGEVA